MNMKCQQNIISILKVKVKWSLIFKSRQSESLIKFSLDQLESTTQIWVAQLEVDNKCHKFLVNFHRLI